MMWYSMYFKTLCRSETKFVKRISIYGLDYKKLCRYAWQTLNKRKKFSLIKTALH